MYVDPLIILSTVCFALVSIAACLVDANGRKAIGVARAWAGSLLTITGVKVTVEGLDRIRGERGYVFVANHLSYMDTPVVLNHIPAEFRFLAKEGLFQIPFLGTHLKQAGHIPVPLDNPRGALRTLSHAAEVIQEKGISLLIFPEGGRSEDGELQEFRDGAAYLAIKAQAPLVPVAIIGTRQILAKRSATFRRGRVQLRIGEPISTEGLTLKDRARLTACARERIVAML